MHTILDVRHHSVLSLAYLLAMIKCIPLIAFTILPAIFPATLAYSHISSGSVGTTAGSQYQPYSSVHWTNSTGYSTPYTFKGYTTGSGLGTGAVSSPLSLYNFTKMTTMMTKTSHVTSVPSQTPSKATGDRSTRSRCKPTPYTTVITLTIPIETEVTPPGPDYTEDLSSIYDSPPFTPESINTAETTYGV
jgi:hypothetical protein